jgi:hypothetical protein
MTATATLTVSDGTSEDTNQRENVQGADAVVVKADSQDADASDITLSLLGTISAGDTPGLVDGQVSSTVDLTADTSIVVFEVEGTLVEADIRVENTNGGGTDADVNLTWRGVE